MLRSNGFGSAFFPCHRRGSFTAETFVWQQLALCLIRFRYSGVIPETAFLRFPDDGCPRGAVSGQDDFGLALQDHALRKNSKGSRLSPLAVQANSLPESPLVTLSQRPPTAAP